MSGFDPPAFTPRPWSVQTRAVGRGWRWWSRVLTLRVPPSCIVPFVTTDEDGDTAYAVGHWDRKWFIQALYDNARLDGWEVSLEICDKRTLRVRHTYRAERFLGDELMPECPFDTPGATPFTECVLTWH